MKIDKQVEEEALLDDITENKTKEKILKTKTALLEAQLNATNDGILVIDKDRKRIITNKRIIELFNIPQIIQDDKNDAVLLEYVVSLTKNPKQFLEKVLYLYDHPNETSSDEIEFKSGLILARYSAPVLGDNGINYGRIWTFRDITKQKELENLFFKEKQEQQTILDSIPAWIFYKDTKNNFIRVNQTFANVMGVPKNELEGKSLFDIYPKEQADKFSADDQEVIKSGQPKIGIIEPIESSKGTLWVKTDKILHRDEQGNIIGIIGFTIDITAQKIAEDKIKIHSEEIEKMNQFMVDRELKMVELKEEIAELKKQPKL